VPTRSPASSALIPRRHTATSFSEHPSRSNVMNSTPPPSYRCTSPPMDGEFAEDLPEASAARPAARRGVPKSPAACRNALGFDTQSEGIVHLNSYLASPRTSTEFDASSSPATRLWRLRRNEPPLQIVIPQSSSLNDHTTSAQPVTALYFPHSDAGDICPSPEKQSFLYRDSQSLSDDDEHAFAASYDSAAGETLGARQVTNSPLSAAYSPRSPPPLARHAYISLPSEEALEQSARTSSGEASFNMLQLHDVSSHWIHTTRERVKDTGNGYMHLVTNLPQEVDEDMLSPLKLMPAPSLCLEDLQEPLSSCLDAMDWINLSLASCSMISQTEVHSLCTTLIAVLSRIKKATIGPTPDVDLLAKAHGMEWRIKYGVVIESLERNINHFLIFADHLGRRSIRTHRITRSLERLWWYARKFDDIEHRLEIFHDHMHVLEMRAELRKLSLTERTGVDV